MSKSEKKIVSVPTRLFMEALDKALQHQTAQADPRTLARAEEASAAGDTVRADYWRTKALRLNTRRGIQTVRRNTVGIANVLASRAPKTEDENGPPRTT